MKLIVKIILGIVALFLLVLIAAGAYVKFFVDADDLKAAIAAEVEKSTGRAFAIEGDLKFSVFPWVSFAIGRTRLGEDPAFGNGDFLSFDSASAGIKLLPLFSGQIEMDKVKLNGLSLNLIRNAAGEDNWATLAAGDDASAAPATTTSSENSFFSTGKIGGLEVSNATVVFDDRQARSKYTMSNFQASTGAISSSDPQVALRSEFDVTVSDPQLSAHVVLSGDGRLDGDTIRIADPRLTVSGAQQELSEDFKVDAFEMALSAPSMAATDNTINMPTPTMSLTASGGSVGKMDATFKAQSLDMLLNEDRMTLPSPSLNVEASGGDLPADLDMTLTANTMRVSPTAEKLELVDYNLTAMGITATGGLVAQNWSSALRASGPLSVAKFSLRDLLARMDSPVDTADKNAMDDVTLKGDLVLGPNSATINKLVMRLDDTQITGSAGLSDLERSAMAFDLNLDKIDADRYLAPTAAPAEGAGGSAADEILLPVETLRTTYAKGTLKIGELKFSGIESTNVEVGINADAGNVRIFPSRATLYGGSYTGDIRINATGATPTLSLNETVTGIDFKAFAATVMPDVPMSGRLTGNILADARGATTAALQSTLNGTLGFDFADGVVEGVDLWHSVQSIVALADKSAPPAARAGAKRTEFEQLKGTARMVNGVMSIESMIASVPHLDVTGAGQVNLVDSSVNVKVEAKIVEEQGEELLPRERSLVGFRVPVYVGGTIDAPSIDTGKSVGGVIAQIAKRKLADKFGLLGNDNKDGTSQTDVDTAVDVKKEELKDKVDDKAKDLLRGLFGGKKDKAEGETP